MKTRFPALLLLVGAAAAIAQEPPSRPAPPPFEKGTAPPREDDNEGLPRLVQITVEFIEVPTAEANRLLYKEKLGKDGNRLRAELQKMVDEGKAALVDVMLITSRSGQKSTVESILEMIYPTEYDPPVIPGSFHEGTAPPKVSDAWANGIPTSFETRNTGNTLEIEPVLSDDERTIDLRFIPELVFKTGDTVHQVRKDPLGNESKIETPLFYSMRTSTAITLTDGGTTLAALLSPKSTTGATDLTKKVFVLVRADVLVVKP